MDFHEYLLKDPDFLKYNIKFYDTVREHHLTTELVTDSEGKKNLIIYDRNFFSYVQDSKRVYIDGTFKVVPKRCGKQLLVFMVEIYEGKVKALEF